MQQIVRTTITLPIHIHEEWRLESVAKKVSMGDLILEKTGVRKRKTKVSLQKQIENDLRFFANIGKSGSPINAVTAVREERDRDNA